VLVLIVIAAIAIVAAVIFLAVGRGGGLSAERNDYRPLDLGPVSATDVALLRPPTGLWGYNMQATDEAMERIAESIRERDVRIVALEQLVTDLSRDQPPAPLLVSPSARARHRREPAAPAQAQALQAHPGFGATGEFGATGPSRYPSADEMTWPPVAPPAGEGRGSSGPPGAGTDVTSAPPEQSHD
jgi:hypothetical protein